MSEKDKPIGTAEIGMIRVGRAAVVQLTAQEIQAGIARTMGEVVRSASNPQRLIPEAQMQRENVKPTNAPAVQTFGWANEKKLESPIPKGSFIEGVVGGMIDRALGPAVPKKREDGGADAD